MGNQRKAWKEVLLQILIFPLTLAIKHDFLRELDLYIRTPVDLKAAFLAWFLRRVLRKLVK